MVDFAGECLTTRVLLTRNLLLYFTWDGGVEMSLINFKSLIGQL